MLHSFVHHDWYITRKAVTNINFLYIILVAFVEKQDLQRKRKKEMKHISMAYVTIDHTV